MDRFRIFSCIVAVALLLAALPASLAAEETRGGPADPTAKTLPIPHDAGTFATYLDPKLRGEGPDAIERSDFEQARKVSSQTPAPASPNPSASKEDSRPPSAHEGHSGHGPGAASKDRGAR